MVGQLFNIGDIIFLYGLPKAFQPLVTQFFISRRFSYNRHQFFYGIVDCRADCSRRTVHAFKGGGKFLQQQYRAHGSQDLILARNLTDFRYSFLDS